MTAANFTGLKAAARLIAGRSDWADDLRITRSELRASFLAPILATPAIAVSLAGYHRVMSDNASRMGGADAIEPLAQALQVTYASFFVGFFLYVGVIIAFADVFRTAGREFSYIIIHNWTVLLLNVLQAIPFGLYLMDAAPLEAALAGFLAALALAIYARWRALRAVLGADRLLSAALLLGGVLLVMIARNAFRYALT